MAEITIPDFSLVVLIGVSGSGKSTFAAKHFKETEVLSSDRFRALVSDDENSLDATTDAFDALHYLARVRLRRRRLVVIDATNIQSDARKPFLKIAVENDALPVAIVLNLPERLCQDRNLSRHDRDFGPHVIRNQSRQLRQSLKKLRAEGFRHVTILNTPEEADSASITRTPLWTDRRREHGPFDIVGDVHGCIDELRELLGALGYSANSAGVYRHPEGRKLVFLGDLADRGPGVVEVFRLVMDAVAAKSALCVPGNHDIKLMRWLQGKNVQVTHGLADSIAQIEALPEDAVQSFRQEAAIFVDRLVSHYLLDDGKLVVAHAGMKELYQGRASGRVRDFAIWGDTTGETDEFGLPVRYPWAEDYRGSAMVVYGHTPVPEPEWLNRTINIDTGCVFGGRLTALRYPEREIVQVPAKRVYAQPAKPFLDGRPATADAEEPISTLQWAADELLRAEDVLGKRIVQTRLAGNVTVRAENSAAAPEVMSRFAVEPRWIIYLPPTMSPSETTQEPGFLEYPREAFNYFRNQGVESVVCQTKHMGSRAIVVLCRDESAASRRFGARGTIGECYTRTGRRFFNDESLHNAFLSEAAAAVGRTGLWDELETDWICLDCELMPWNAKAQALLRDQYAPVAAAGRLSLETAIESVKQAAARGIPLEQVADTLERRRDNVERYRLAYAQYCWDVNGLQYLQLAPFHVLASEGRTYFDRDHEWQISVLSRLADQSDLFRTTESRSVNLRNVSEESDLTDWWVQYTESGGEGMVVKPKDFVARGSRGLIQPAVKVRGREYPRIIYGLEYTEEANLTRLRNRFLGAKRGLAVKEFALGVEGLERFVRREPLRRVHECAFAVLSLESEPVDPRL
jgi:protein phosphatase